MMQVDVDARQIQVLVRRLEDGRQRAKSTRHQLAMNIGAAFQELAEQRVRVTKIAPDGTPWRDWSDEYAKTRSSGDSLLVATGELLDSFDHSASPAGQVVKIENVAPHAAFVNALRPILGVGPLEERAVDDCVEAWLGGLT